jgi:2-amino-4-hydroxy-6-hydroxymethyldihydropteridine diphosphokinase
VSLDPVSVESANLDPVAVDAVLAFGSNLGDRSSTIQQAIVEVDALERVAVIGTSSLYESVALKPEGADPDAPAYVNACILVRTTLEPHALLAKLNAIELAHGRVREEHWGDRTLDIDIVTYGDAQQSDETLTVPHPLAWQRDFVLAPWLELDPQAVLPGRGRVDELLSLTENSVRRREDNR